MPRKKSPSFLFLALLLILSADQLIKVFVTRFSGRYVINYGFPLVGGDFSILVVELSILLAILFMFLVLKLNLIGNKRTGLAVCLIFSGIISNLIDRILRGGVVDYIDIRVWPVFNLSDVLILLGVIWLGLLLLYRKI